MYRFMFYNILSRGAKYDRLSGIQPESFRTLRIQTEQHEIHSYSNTILQHVLEKVLERNATVLGVNT